MHIHRASPIGTTTTVVRVTAAFALACTTLLGFVATVQARPVHIVHSHSAASSLCKHVITGAPWRNAGRSGNTYMLVAVNVSCSSVRARVVAFTYRPNPAYGRSFDGPPGFKCVSTSSTPSGDTRLYSGGCFHTPNNDRYFQWFPKP